jgi:hypothetical protein
MIRNEQKVNKKKETAARRSVGNWTRPQSGGFFLSVAVAGIFPFSVLCWMLDDGLGCSGTGALHMLQDVLSFFLSLYKHEAPWRAPVPISFYAPRPPPTRPPFSGLGCRI